MVKIDFSKRTIQLWLEEYQGIIKISSTSLCFHNSQGKLNSILLPDGWLKPNVACIDEILPSVPDLPLPTQENSNPNGERASKVPVPDLAIFEIILDALKNKIEKNFEKRFFSF